MTMHFVKQAAVWDKKLSYRLETAQCESLPKFAQIRCGNGNLHWNDFQILDKVIESGNIRKIMYDFILVVYSNFCPIMHCLREIWYQTV